MSKLDYEPRVPQAPRAPGARDVAWSMVCSIGGASVGAAAVMAVSHAAYDEMYNITSVCGLIGGTLTISLAYPLIMSVKSPLRRLLLSALLGFLMTAGLLILLWLGLFSGSEFED